MLRIVLPAVTTTGPIASRILSIVYVLSIIYVLPVRIINEGVVIIDIYFIITSPAAVAAPASTPGRSHSHPNAE